MILVPFSETYQAWQDDISVSRHILLAAPVPGEATQVSAKSNTTASQRDQLVPPVPSQPARFAGSTSLEPGAAIVIDATGWRRKQVSDEK